MTQDNTGSENKTNKKIDEKQIEELYRLAEIIQSTGDQHDAERKRIAAERMAAILQKSREAHIEETVYHSEHRWVLAVLNDLVRYAELHNLSELDKVLGDARFKTAQILGRKP